MEKDQKRVDVINFMAPLNDTTVCRLIDLTHTAQSEGSSEIHLFISSTGGRLHTAFTAYNFFQSLDIPFYTQNVGSVEAAALILYLASDNRSAAPNTKFSLSTFEWYFYRNTVPYCEVIEAYESLSLDVKRYAEIFRERAKSDADFESWLAGPAKVMDPQQALEAGIVTNPKIAFPQLSDLSKLWTIHD